MSDPKPKPEIVDAPGGTVNQTRDALAAENIVETFLAACDQTSGEPWRVNAAALDVLYLALSRLEADVAERYERKVAASKVLWERLNEWQGEWSAAHPEKPLTHADTLSLIEWKMRRLERATWEKARTAAANYTAGVNVKSSEAAALRVEAAALADGHDLAKPATSN